MALGGCSLVPGVSGLLTSSWGELDSEMVGVVNVSYIVRSLLKPSAATGGFFLVAML